MRAAFKNLLTPYALNIRALKHMKQNETQAKGEIKFTFNNWQNS